MSHDLTEIDPNDDELFLEALSAYSDELYTSLGNLACLLRMRESTGRGPNLVDLHMRALSMKDHLLFAVRAVAPGIEARLTSRECEGVSAQVIHRGVVDLEACRQWRALSQTVLANPAASVPPALAVVSSKGGDAH